jgi:hypothetical protein
MYNRPSSRYLKWEALKSINFKRRHSTQNTGHARCSTVSSTSERTVSQFWRPIVAIDHESTQVFVYRICYFDRFEPNGQNRHVCGKVIAKIPNIKFNENSSGGNRSDPCGRTDKRSHTTKLTVAFSSLFFTCLKRRYIAQSGTGTQDFSFREFEVSSRTAVIGITLLSIVILLLWHFCAGSHADLGLCASCTVHHG